MDDRPKSITYLPDYLKDFIEIKEIMKVCDQELDSIDVYSNVPLKNAFVNTADEDGIKNFEESYKCEPNDTDALEDRRNRIKLKGYENVKYLENTLVRLIENATQARAIAEIDHQRMYIYVKVELKSKKEAEMIEKLLNKVLPENVAYKVQIMWNRHIDLSKFTHAELAKYTHRQLREEVFE